VRTEESLRGKEGLLDVKGACVLDLYKLRERQISTSQLLGAAYVTYSMCEFWKIRLK
jgi:hypothetical protein